MKNKLIAFIKKNFHYWKVNKDYTERCCEWCGKHQYNNGISFGGMGSYEIDWQDVKRAK